MDLKLSAPLVGLARKLWLRDAVPVRSLGEGGMLEPIL